MVRSYSRGVGNDIDGSLDRLEELLAEIEQFEPGVRDRVFELLDGIDAIHRFALDRLGEELGQEALAALRGSNDAIRWLFDAYGVGVDQHRAAEEALESIRPYIQSHGGSVDVLEVAAGVVRVKLSGACSGCTASAVTLRNGVEEALREGVPGFSAMEVEVDDAPPHAPPGPTLLQIGPVPARPSEDGTS